MNSLLKVSIKLKSLPWRVFLILYISTTIYKTRDFPFFFKQLPPNAFLTPYQRLTNMDVRPRLDAMKKLGDSPSSADDLKEAYCRWDRKHHTDWVCLSVMNAVNVSIWYCFQCLGDSIRVCTICSEVLWSDWGSPDDSRPDTVQCGPYSLWGFSPRHNHCLPCKHRTNRWPVSEVVLLILY